MYLKNEKQFGIKKILRFRTFLQICNILAQKTD